MLNRYCIVAFTLCLSAAMAFAESEVKPHKHPATRPSTQAALVPYPLKTCIVSDEELGGDMGDPIVINYQGREIKFCCSSCPKKFYKDPAKYLKKLDDAAKKQAATQAVK